MECTKNQEFSRKCPLLCHYCDSSTFYREEHELQLSVYSTVFVTSLFNELRGGELFLFFSIISYTNGRNCILIKKLLKKREGSPSNISRYISLTLVSSLTSKDGEIGYGEGLNYSS